MTNIEPATCECCGHPIEAPAVQIGDLMFLTRKGVHEMPVDRAPIVHTRCVGTLIDGMVIEVEATLRTED